MEQVAKKMRGGPTPRSLSERLDARVSPEPNTGCHLWTGYVSRGGYGRIGAGGGNAGMLATHRVAWELYCGPIPDGLQVLHRCDTPSCCNPDHLFVGSIADNMADRTAKGRGVRGERAGLAKLTEALVMEARRLRAEGLPYAEIGRRIGISQSHAYRVCAGLRWKHVK